MSTYSLDGFLRDYFTYEFMDVFGGPCAGKFRIAKGRVCYAEIYLLVGYECGERVKEHSSTPVGRR